MNKAWAVPQAENRVTGISPHLCYWRSKPGSLRPGGQDITGHLQVCHHPVFALSVDSDYLQKYRAKTFSVQFQE
jgi:hypothetical protein